MLYATIMLDKERKVKFTLRQQIDLEKMYPFFQKDPEEIEVTDPKTGTTKKIKPKKPPLLMDLCTSESPEVMVNLLWKGLQSEDHELNYEGTLDLLENADYTLIDIREVVNQAAGYAIFGKSFDDMMKSTEAEKSNTDTNTTEATDPNAQSGQCGMNTSAPESAT